MLARAELLVVCGRKADAEEDLRAALARLDDELAEEDGTGDRARRSAALLALGRARDAEKEARRATALDPRSPDAWAHLSRALAARGELDGARTAAGLALELDAYRLLTRLAVAEAAAARGDTGEARAAIAWLAAWSPFFVDLARQNARLRPLCDGVSAALLPLDERDAPAAPITEAELSLRVRLPPQRALVEGGLCRVVVTALEQEGLWLDFAFVGDRHGRLKPFSGPETARANGPRSDPLHASRHRRRRVPVQLRPAHAR